MISWPAEIDLGRDRKRIKDPNDAVRQRRTAETILRRFFDPRESVRREVQILADEVGMGKTYVALAVAYAMLRAMQSGDAPADLTGCYQKVLILTPPGALHEKWRNEIGEFAKRCVNSDSPLINSWSKPLLIERLDDLPSKLRLGNPVLLGGLNLFAEGKFTKYELKRRRLLALLFRYWGVRFPNESRELLLRGAPDGWPTKLGRLSDFSDEEIEQLVFTEDELYHALKSILAGRNDSSEKARKLVDRILERCREAAIPFTRDRDAHFSELKKPLIDLYRLLMDRLIRQAFPLVIVDEAHNWKNGPETGAWGWEEFVRLIARRTRRLLMLTATPFQLRPEEMLEIMKTADYLEPRPPFQDPGARTRKLESFREKVIRPVLKESERISRDFTRQWQRLPVGTTTAQLREIWLDSNSLDKVRKQLNMLANEDEPLDEARQKLLIETALRWVQPPLRAFFRTALELFTRNVDLSQELGSLIIRHRRQTDHRLFLVGEEFTRPAEQTATRPDRKVLHAAPGMDVRGNAELPHYLLMRCVSEMKRSEGRLGRSSLGSNLTGCYSTLLQSADGNAVKKALVANPDGRPYLDLLLNLVSERNDSDHPKMKAVVDRVLAYWQRGEKSLIFCFRVNTAKRLREILDARVRKEIDSRARRVLGGEVQLRSLRQRLTSKKQDLATIGFDRVLYSLWCKSGYPSAIEKGDFLLNTQEDMLAIARLALARGVSLDEERPDRVFIHRAVEHLLARRWCKRKDLPKDWYPVLTAIAEQNWVDYPYGLTSESQEEEGEGENRHDFDERGVHSTYSAQVTPNEVRVNELCSTITTQLTRLRAGNRIYALDQYARSPNFWLGRDSDNSDSASAKLMTDIHGNLWGLTAKGGNLDWESRRQVMQALRRATLRRSVLLRLLPEKSDREEQTWGELLVERFMEPMPGQRESLGHRLGIFLEDLAAASGSLSDPKGQGGARESILEATRLSDQLVALVGGESGTRGEARNRVFQGFNSPLFPDILVCTSVGAEGIDLHRHCRHVIHYDLAWNPAVLEQRTGRVDRIGSKTFRERDEEQSAGGTFLEIGVPFLAGTYDERMFEELRLRAQTFEMLTGGDYAADHAEGNDEDKDAEGRERGMFLIALPAEIVNDLRVKLHVWSAAES